MKAVKVTCENGISWTTSVSDKSTPKSKDAYFLGQMFNTGSYPEEIMSKCVSAEYIYPVDSCDSCGCPINLDCKCPQCDYTPEIARCDIVGNKQ